ncbi:ABC transporter ATP-binding protein [uncultured Jatrophihabitans sp.]|uniref:ABC transporter ATP-binding protein n=1 Tax=uncultured Jatrophihabitans sp. TaxID=1610747 RepID=UPI0035CB4FF5
MTEQERDAVPALEAHGITVTFGGLTAVNNVDIRIMSGKIVGLIGPNGAGKSTLFSVLSGLLRPRSGQVLINGEDVTHASPQQRAHRGMARTFQHPELFLGLTVREHVVLAYRVAQTPRRIWTDMVTAGGFRPSSRAENERVDLIISGLNLTDIQHRPAVGLPLGLARLVELARSFAREPRFLLLDEASSGLDAAETEELQGVLRQMVERRGVSLLMVEHDVEMVLGMADYVYVLDFGSLIAEGTPEQIRTNADVRAAYLGEQIDAPPAAPAVEVTA